jgi:hypothetical protein
MCVGNLGNMTQGTASMIGQAAGAVSSGVGAFAAASSAKAGLNMQAYFNDLNTKLEMDNSREALREGQFQEQQVDLNAAKIKSSQRAALGASGVDMSTGSALNEQVSTDYMASIDKITVEQNAARAAAGYSTAATSYASEANMQRTAASGISPLLSGFTSLVGSAGKIAQDWYRLNKVGATTPTKQPLSDDYIQGSFGAIGGYG